MYVNLVLCDHAEVANGKLFINGGGWTFISPGPAVLALAGIIEVPWDETNRPHTVCVDLLDSDGQPFLAPDGITPIRLEDQFEVGRPAGHPVGASLRHPLVMAIAGIPMPAGGRFVFVVTIDGIHEPSWEMPFSVMQQLPVGAQ